MSRQTIFPSLRYRDARAAVDWLENAFGFERVAVYGDDNGVVHHAEVRFGDGRIRLGAARGPEAGEYSAVAPPPGNAALYAIVDDPDAHHDRAKAAGAEIVMGLRDQDYGSREYTARDLDGNIWTFGTYDPNAAG
jgi:uncharacterized glyoxalase superfamily protein PhnB